MREIALFVEDAGLTLTSCNVYPLDLFFSEYNLSDSFDNTSCIFGRAREHRPCTQVLPLASCLLPLASCLLPLASYTFPFGVQR